MNRLWVRISLAITGIVLFAIILPMIIGIGTRNFSFDDAYPAPAGINWANREKLEDRPNSFVPGNMIVRRLQVLWIAVAVLGIGAGILLGRSLSAPLSQLAEAARAIGQRNLSQRVPVRGSQEIKELAQAFNEMAVDLENAENLRQNLLADVAHELRTPLTVIQGNLQALLDDVYELDKVEIAQLYDQTRHLSRLVDDLRELAQAEAHQLDLDMGPVDMRSLVADVVTAYQPMAEVAGVQLQTESAADLPGIDGDRSRLIQCLQNLLNNAMRYTPAGGQVNLRLQAIDQNLVLIIRDSGAGIPPEHLPHVFDRFYRADPARARGTGGTGLGLAITRAIIRAHGGEIKAESPGRGQGSTFTIHMPIHQEPIRKLEKS